MKNEFNPDIVFHPIEMFIESVLEGGLCYEYVNDQLNKVGHSFENLDETIEVNEEIAKVFENITGISSKMFLKNQIEYNKFKRYDYK